MNTDKHRFKISNLKLICVYSCLLTFICGCKSANTVSPAKYFGPTDPMARVIADVNANNARVTTLVGSGTFEAMIRQQGHENYLNGTISLAYAYPHSLRIFGKKDIVGPIFELGSNDERFWMIQRLEGGTLYTGTYKNLSKIDADEMPVRPDLVLEVLGVQTVPVDLLTEPVPQMRFNNDADAYMFTWSQKLADRWIVVKEIWYDRATKLPMLVHLFDENGRIIIHADLADHQPVRIENVPQAQWPKVATAYTLMFPDSRSWMRFTLKDDLAATRNGAPNRLSFTYPGPERAGVGRVRDFDEQLAP